MHGFSRASQLQPTRLSAHGLWSARGGAPVGSPACHVPELNANRSHRVTVVLGALQVPAVHSRTSISQVGAVGGRCVGRQGWGGGGLVPSLEAPASWAPSQRARASSSPRGRRSRMRSTLPLPRFDWARAPTCAPSQRVGLPLRGRATPGRLLRSKPGVPTAAAREYRDTTWAYPSPRSPAIGPFPGCSSATEVALGCDARSVAAASAGGNSQRQSRPTGARPCQASEPCRPGRL